MVNWLLPSAPADKLIPKEQQHSAFIKYRTRILVSTILAYASYYIVKSNFTLSSPYLTKDVGLTTADIGLVLSALAISYGIGKFFMGLLADRLNPRYFVGVGLILSAIFNTFFGYTQFMGNGSIDDWCRCNSRNRCSLLPKIISNMV